MLKIFSRNVLESNHGPNDSLKTTRVLFTSHLLFNGNENTQKNLYYPKAKKAGQKPSLDLVNV